MGLFFNPDNLNNDPTMLFNSFGRNSNSWNCRPNFLTTLISALICGGSTQTSYYNPRGYNNTTLFNNTLPLGDIAYFSGPVQPGFTGTVTYTQQSNTTNISGPVQPGFTGTVTYTQANDAASTVGNSNSVKVDTTDKTDKTDKTVQGGGTTRELYNSLGLEKEGLGYEVFSLAMEGYQNLKNKGNGYLGIVDPNSKCYYLIDVNNKKFIEKSVVRFGSGNMNNVKGANIANSHATLSGFMQVKEEYASRKSHWSSRAKRMDGLEQGINNNARSKSVVIHSTTKNTTWGCIGFTPVLNKNGQTDDAATNEKLRRLFPSDTIIFSCPTNVDEYKNLSALV
ncbi:MAG: murein L,D-transpeptidase catalytic domain family protein [Candidatus Gastranaerophilales bacterium]|nr:murein L,D-transpeptidase catalytic domain family protein [Candidatus Gastranaerophilales bacterium]